MNATITLTIKQIVKTAYPDYRGRKVRVATESIPTKLDSYWNDGYRDFYVFVRLHDMQLLAVHSNHPAFESRQPRTLRCLPKGIALVRRTYCGMNQSITVWFGTDQGSGLPMIE